MKTAARTTTATTAARTVAAAVVALTLALAGCSGSANSATEPGSPQTVAGGAAGAPANADSDRAGEAKEGEVASTERQVARTAQVSVKIADPAVAAQRLRVLAEGLGGFVTSERVVTEQRDGYYLRASTVVIQVPSERLDEALDALAQVGTVTDRVVNSADVTAQVVDVDARIKTLRESIARIEQLMTKAGSVAEIAQVEAELTSRQTRLESLLAQQKTLAARVAMAPITITLNPDVTVAEPNPLLQGLAAGWEALLVSLRALITFLGAVLPFAALALVVWLPVRVWLRRRTPRARGAAQASTGGTVAGTDHARTDGARTDGAGADRAGADGTGSDTDGTVPTDGARSAG